MTSQILTHEQSVHLLGALALDAVEPDEFAALEEHLARCARCRGEIRRHHQTLQVLVGAVEPPTAGAPLDLRTRVLGASRRPSQPPGRTLRLRSASGDLDATIVLQGTDGHLFADRLPALVPGSVHVLWGLNEERGNAGALGVLGPVPSLLSFTVVDDEVDAFAISEEASLARAVPTTMLVVVRL